MARGASGRRAWGRGTLNRSLGQTERGLIEMAIEPRWLAEGITRLPLERDASSKRPFSHFLGIPNCGADAQAGALSL